MILVIVNDTKIKTSIEKKILTAMGYEVLSALDEKHGLELALLRNPDLILIGGKTISPSLNSTISIIHQSKPSIPIILVGAGDMGRIVEAFKLGISNFIPLPLEVKEAQEVVVRALETSRANRKRESDNQKLLMDEAVRITQTTLSHYLNNYLTALDGDLILLRESLQNKDPLQQQLEILKNSQRDTACIKKVIEVLVNTTSIKLTEYDQTSTMIDIDAPLFLEINRILGSNPLDPKDG